MKIHKTWMAVLAAGTLLTLGSSLQAADTNAPAAPGTPPAPGLRGRGMMGPDVDQIAKDLNLTDDQKAKVKTAFDNRRQKMVELFQNGQGGNVSREDRQAKRQAIMDNFNKELKDAGLTQDQIDKIDKMGRGGMRGQRPGGPAGGDNAGGDKAGGENAGDKPQQ